MKILYRQIIRIIKISLQGIVSLHRKIKYIPVKSSLTNESFEKRQIIYRAKPINRYRNVYDGNLYSDNIDK